MVDSTTMKLDKNVAALQCRVESLLERQRSNASGRILVALAGVPGSGKTTVSSALLLSLSKRGMSKQDVVVVPMDGFHYTKATLAGFSNPDMAFRRRGAPFTFDADGLLDLMRALKTGPLTGPDSEEHVFTAPSFDHAVQDPVPDDIRISSRSKIVIIEGNYTLLNEHPWNKMAELVDEKWFVDVPPEVAKERLVLRHLAAGIETSREAAAHRAEENDLPNGHLIRSKLLAPDVRVVN
ncbi:P-loop containing nucleoside triphosphate hydrolase protein [Apiospora arundinis]